MNQTPLTTIPHIPTNVSAMELNSPAGTPTPTTTTTPETDTETPPTKHLSKTLSFPNGSFHHHSPPPPLPVVVEVVYKECLKNHAAALGGHALDGCGEFMPAPTATSTDPTSLKCAACGCHRNFHRRDPEEPPPPPTHAHLIEYHPQNSISPPPISSSYYPSAPQMLLALSTGGGLSVRKTHQDTNGGRKRYRSKFSQEQKDKMYSFSEKLGWKMHKRDEGLVEEFCNEVGVRKGVLKVWMHNNKHTFGKRDPHLSVNGIDTLGVHRNNNNTHVAANCSS